MIVVITTFKIRPGKEAELEDLVKSVLPQVQDEEGSISCVLHCALEEPGKYLFYDAYKDEESLNYHSSTPYFKEFVVQVMPLLSEQPEMVMYKDLASIEK